MPRTTTHDPAWGHTPVRVGLVGAGPWARAMHARTLAAGPETELTAVWARRPEAAAGLAAAYGIRPAASFGELLGRCEAVAFAVPPAVQAALAVRAAAAGRSLLLEKPLGGDLESARAVAEAVPPGHPRVPRRGGGPRVQRSPFLLPARGVPGR
jgi:predicted dehydrogenase